MNNTKSLTYSQVYLKPNYSELSTRADADTSVNFLGRTFKNPVIPANMAAVINEDLARVLAFGGYFYIMHRFCDVRKFVQLTRAESWPLVSISVGVKKEDMEFITDLRDTKCRVDYITIDIAHGHSILMKNMIKFIKKTLPNTKIIAGNVTTDYAVTDLSEWGADAAKVGIAGGAACDTKNATGFHIPMFSCVKDCASIHWIRYETKIPIIADGSIKTHGDIAKALVAGATMVMAGSLLAGCIDAPGENIHETHLLPYGHPDEKKRKITHKVYYGSASAKNKENTGQPIEHIEGFEIKLECNGLTYKEKYDRINQDLASAISYAGGKDLSVFEDVEWVEV